MQLLERAHFDLANALAANIVLRAQLFQSDRLVHQAALGKDILFTVVQNVQRSGQQFAACVQFIARLIIARLISVFIFKPVLPLHGALALGPDGRVQRGIATGHPAVHADDFLFGHAKVIGDLGDVLGAQITFFQRTDAGLGLAQVEEQLFLRGGCAQLHQRPRPQDVFLDRGTNPPHCIGRQTEALFRVEPFDRLHQAHIGLGNNLGLR